MYKPSQNHSDELTEPLVEILFLLERYGCPWRRFLSSLGQRMGLKLRKTIPNAPFEHEYWPSSEKVGKTRTSPTDIKSQPAPATRLDFSRRARALRPPHSNIHHPRRRRRRRHRRRRRGPRGAGRPASRLRWCGCRWRSRRRSDRCGGGMVTGSTSWRRLLQAVL